MKVFTIYCFSKKQCKPISLIVLAAFLVGITGCSTFKSKTANIDDNYILEENVSPERRVFRSYLIGKLAIHGADRKNRKGGNNKEVGEYIDLAVPNLLHVAKQTQDKKLAEQAAQAAIFSQNYELAASASQALEKISGKRGNADYFSALAAIKRLDKKAAVAAIESLIQHSQSLPRTLSDIVGMFSQSNDHAFSVEVMREIVNSNQDIENIDFAYANVLANDASTINEAEEIFESILADNPNDEPATVSLLQIKQQLGDVFATVKAFETAIKTFPDNLEIRQAFAGFLVTQRRYEAALKQYRVLYKATPENMDLAFRLGVLALEVNHPDEAQGYFEQVLQNNMRTNEVMYYLGRVEELKRNYQQALTYYSQVAQGEYRFDALLREAKVLSSMGDTKEALSVIAALQSVNNDEVLDIRLTLSQVDIHIDAKHYSDAEHALNNAIKRHSKVFDLLYARSMVREKLSNIDGAIEDLRILIEQQPNNPDIMNALGYTLANKTDQYEEAYSLISRALKLKPDSAAILDSMGWVSFKKGEINKAYTYLRKAYDIHPDPEIAAHLGEVLYLIGKKQEAQLIWGKAVKTDPDHEVLNDVIEQYPK